MDVSAATVDSCVLAVTVHLSKRPDKQIFTNTNVKVTVEGVFRGV